MTQTHVPVRVAVAVDHSHVLWGLSRVITAEAPCLAYAGGASNLGGLKHLLQTARPDVVVLDVNLDGECTLEHMPEIIRSVCARFVVWADEPSHAVAQRALERGALAVIPRDTTSTQLIDLLLSVTDKHLNCRLET